uniref:Uncharacterized protein n=1 Tax=Vespula pensylvanica TaxID=30213 RepID=A0A834PGF9_VESPE|nr:hypothetical protein H0235_001650 [Vespula pensylvanica]
MQNKSYIEVSQTRILSLLCVFRSKSGARLELDFVAVFQAMEISRTADSRVPARIHLLYSFFPSFKEDSCGSFLACRVPSPPPTTIIGARSIGRRDHSTAREHIHFYGGGLSRGSPVANFTMRLLAHTYVV